MATRGSNRRSAPENTETDPAETNQPATGRRYSDGEPKLATVNPKPVERPYSEAVTKEHRAALAEAGIKITKSTQSEQAASTA